MAEDNPQTDRTGWRAGKPSIARPVVTPTLLDGISSLLLLEMPELVVEEGTLHRRPSGVDQVLSRIGARVERSSAYGGELAIQLLGMNLRSDAHRVRLDAVPIPHCGWIALGEVASRLLSVSSQHTEASRMENGISAVMDAVATALALLERADVVEIDRETPGYRVRHAYLELREISTYATKQMIREKLKQSFPDVKFSLESSSFADGHFVRVHIEWQGEPADADVRAVVHPFQGADFVYRFNSYGRYADKIDRKALLMTDGEVVRLEEECPVGGRLARDFPDGAELVQFLVDDISVQRREKTA